MMPVSLIRPLNLAEVETLVDWARVEGWNPGLNDAPGLFATDPEGFIGCFIDNRLVAGISAVRYGADFGFIGLYISHPDFRGKGYGRRVWDAGATYLQDRTIGLDGVPEQQANYRSMGFHSVYETVRWSGRLGSASQTCTIPVTTNLLPLIATYDRNFFPAERDAFLNEWLKPPRIARAIVREGTISGYAVARKCHDGYKIGPLFADDIADAQALIGACAAETQGETLHIDVPAFQTEFAAGLEGNGFSKGFTTARMYRGLAPGVRIQGVFGITTLELG